MSFRVKLSSEDGRHYQVFGNNEHFVPLEQWVVENGAEVDGDGCFYDFELPNLEEFLDLVVQFLKELPFDVYDLTPTNKEDRWNAREMVSAYQNSYLSIIPNLIKTYRDLIKTEYDGDSDSFRYSLKEGAKLYLSAY